MMEAMHSTPDYIGVEEFTCKAPHILLVLQHPTSEYATQLKSKIPSATIIVPILNNEHAMVMLLEEVQQQLSQNPVGTHMVICGDEVFLWDVQHAVAVQGCLAEEMSLILDANQPTAFKKVYCVHCFHLQITSQEEYLQCEKCRVELFIRSHFSERLGAYMGVCADPQKTHQYLSSQTGAKSA